MQGKFRSEKWEERALVVRARRKKCLQDALEKQARRLKPTSKPTRAVGRGQRGGEEPKNTPNDTAAAAASAAA